MTKWTMDRLLLNPAGALEELNRSAEPSPAQEENTMVTDEMVKRDATEYLSHKGERPYRVTRLGAELWEDHAPAIRAALEAALSAAEPVASAGEEIADAVLSWMVKYDLLDAGNEYRAADVIAVLDDFKPSYAPEPSVAVKALQKIADMRDNEDADLDDILLIAEAALSAAPAKQEIDTKPAT